MPAKARSIEIEEDLPFHRRSWVVQRVGWAAMALVVLLALLGAFGGGWLPTATAGEPGGPLRLEFPRLGRAQAQFDLRVHVAPEAVRGDRIRIWLSRAYVQRAGLSRVLPAAERTLLDADRVIWEFAIQPGSGDRTVVFEFDRPAWGRHAGQVGLDGGPELGFRQFLFP